MTDTKTHTVTDTTITPQSDAIKVAVMNNDMRHIGETLIRLETSFSETNQRIEAKLDNAIVGFVTHDKLEDHRQADIKKHEEQDARTGKLEDWNSWAVRIVLGAVIVAVLGLVIVQNTNAL